MRIAWIVVLLVLLGASSVFGDTCSIRSEPWSVYSANHRWRFVITSDEWKTERRTATLYRVEPNGGWRRHARWTVANLWGPADAAVANDGAVITLDNICGSGVGSDILVIYRPDGTLVRTFELADLLVEEDIRRLPHTVSSIPWLLESHIEEATRQLVLEVGRRGEESIELEVSLETGELLTPKRRRFDGS